MLTCIYHPVHPMRVVESDEADALKATGGWFNCPKKAREHKENMAREIDTGTKPKLTHKTRGTK